MPHRACVLGLDEQSDWSSGAQDLRAYLQVSQIRLQAPLRPPPNSGCTLQMCPAEMLIKCDVTKFSGFPPRQAVGQNGDPPAGTRSSVARALRAAPCKSVVRPWSVRAQSVLCPSHCPLRQRLLARAIAVHAVLSYTRRLPTLRWQCRSGTQTPPCSCTCVYGSTHTRYYALRASPAHLIL